MALEDYVVRWNASASRCNFGLQLRLLIRILPFVSDGPLSRYLALALPLPLRLAGEGPAHLVPNFQDVHPLSAVTIVGLARLSANVCRRISSFFVLGSVPLGGPIGHTLVHWRKVD